MRASSSCIPCNCHIFHGFQHQWQLVPSILRLMMTLLSIEIGFDVNENAFILSCKSSNVIYSLNCTKCRHLLYIGETGCPLHRRINCHRSDGSHDDKVVYQHFQLPGHSPSDMKVQILEKVHQEFGTTKLAKPVRERVELKWLNELCTAAPYGLNDKINGVGILTSPSTSEVNRIGICNK